MMEEDKFDRETISEVERIFFSLEKEYINELLKMPEFHNYLMKYYAYSNKNLIALFSRLQEQMENGQIRDEDEDMVELSMIACILAMSEKLKLLIKMKTRDREKEEIGHARGRR